MTDRHGNDALRLETALRLLPELDGLTHLRGLLIRTSQLHTHDHPDGTVGKRQIHPKALEEARVEAVARAASHTTRLYEASIVALEQQRKGDVGAVVSALLEAGALEEQLGRFTQAFSWYQHAQDAARPLRDRRSEIAALRRLAGLQLRRERFEEAARHYQRALALAEAESDRANAAGACHGLADVALAQARWQGAEAWCMRGLQHAEEDQRCRADLLVALAQTARQRGNRDAAGRALDQARDLFEAAADRQGLARALNEGARLARSRGHLLEALALHQDALARLRDAPSDPRLEIEIRLDLCRLHTDWGRLREAEDEGRRVEERAIADNLLRELALAYLVLGNVRARRNDEGGFVFFENAIALCRGHEPLPRLEAEAYLEYGLYCHGLGDQDDAAAYLARAREILEGLGDDPLLPQVRAKLAQLGAA